jgi:hypothetical protein
MMTAKQRVENLEAILPGATIENMILTPDQKHWGFLATLHGPSGQEVKAEFWILADPEGDAAGFLDLVPCDD